MAPTKWSIVGAGRIWHDFVPTFSINTKVNFCYILVLTTIYLNFASGCGCKRHQKSLRICGKASNCWQILLKLYEQLAEDPQEWKLHMWEFYSTIQHLEVVRIMF